MKLYVMELLKKDGQPYKKARFSEMGFVRRSLSDSVDFFGSIQEAAEECVRLKVDGQPCRIRTLALLPVGGE